MRELDNVLNKTSLATTFTEELTFLSFRSEEVREPETTTWSSDLVTRVSCFDAPRKHANFNSGKRRSFRRSRYTSRERQPRFTHTPRHTFRLSRSLCIFSFLVSPFTGETNDPIKPRLPNPHGIFYSQFRADSRYYSITVDEPFSAWYPYWWWLLYSVFHSYYFCSIRSLAGVCSWIFRGFTLSAKWYNIERGSLKSEIRKFTDRNRS